MNVFHIRNILRTDVLFNSFRRKAYLLGKCAFLHSDNAIPDMRKTVCRGNETAKCQMINTLDLLSHIGSGLLTTEPTISFTDGHMTSDMLVLGTRRKIVGL